MAIPDHVVPPLRCVSRAQRSAAPRLNYDPQHLIRDALQNRDRGKLGLSAVPDQRCTTQRSAVKPVEGTCVHLRCASCCTASGTRLTHRSGLITIFTKPHGRLATSASAVFTSANG